MASRIAVAPRGLEPVNLGAAKSRALITDSCLINELWFPAGASLAPHRHSRGVFAVMLDGSFDTVHEGHSIECTPNLAWAEPPEERHANRMGSRGAHVLAVQPDPTLRGPMSELNALLNSRTQSSDPTISADARRIVRELGVRDNWSPAVIESLVITMASTLSRSASRDESVKLPSWLQRARDVIHASYRTGIKLTELAELVDVHPSHLAHAFRRHLGCTVGDYARRLRREWALTQIRTTGTAFSTIAIASGYCDQAHLSRDFTRNFGASPSALRGGVTPPRRAGEDSGPDLDVSGAHRED